MRVIPNSAELAEFNTCHTPSGSPQGGQFCSGDKQQAKLPGFTKRTPAERRAARAADRRAAGNTSSPVTSGTPSGGVDPLGGGGVMASYTTTLSDGTHSVKVVYKPVDGEEWNMRSEITNRAFTHAHREAMAYEVDQALGTKLVPETVLRTSLGKDESGVVWGAGSVQRFAENAAVEAYWGGRDLTQEETFRIAALDYVVGNLDRHGKNLMRDGASGNPIGIDHGLTMPAGSKDNPSGMESGRSLAIANLIERHRIGNASPPTSPRASWVDFARMPASVRGGLRQTLSDGARWERVIKRYRSVMSRSEVAAFRYRLKDMRRIVESDDPELFVTSMQRITSYWN